MALGIYKPGQGYWVRVMTAALIAIATFGAVGWLWAQSGSIAQGLAPSSYVFTVRVESDAQGRPTGTPVVGSGQVVRPLPDEDPLPVGTAEIGEVRQANDLYNLVVTGWELGKDRSFAQGDTVIQGAFSARLVTNPERIRSVEPLAIQAPVAAVIMLVGALLAYWLVGHKPRTVDFLIATDMEMRKVNWSNRRNIIRSTGVVIGVALLIAAFLFLFDLGLSQFFKFIGILR